MQNKAAKQNRRPHPDLFIPTALLFLVSCLPSALDDKQIYMQFGIYEGRFINYLQLIVRVNKVGCEALVLKITA